jgi:hypothetical protein
MSSNINEIFSVALVGLELKGEKYKKPALVFKLYDNFDTLSSKR